MPLSSVQVQDRWKQSGLVTFVHQIISLLQLLHTLDGAIIHYDINKTQMLSQLASLRVMY